MKKIKIPSDTNQRAKRIVDITTGDYSIPPISEKNPHAVALGRAGGLKGGKARAANMTAEDRKKAAQKAAQSRWKK
ncbi:MAG: hypothetical protein EBQ80_02835 [Proteobacteria bacterium]|nr:hypothetical protein [Bacteroidota bacterium]NBX86164.1 hypothetical protein [Pseudomonadota bacterium]